MFGGDQLNSIFANSGDDNDNDLMSRYGNKSEKEGGSIFGGGGPSYLSGGSSPSSSIFDSLGNNDQGGSIYSDMESSFSSVHGSKHTTDLHATGATSADITGMDSHNQVQSSYHSDDGGMNGRYEDSDNMASSMNIRASNYGEQSIVDKMRGIQANRLNNETSEVSLSEMYGDSSLDTRVAGGQYNVTIADIYGDEKLFKAYHGLYTDGKIDEKENYMVDNEGDTNRTEAKNDVIFGTDLKAGSDFQGEGRSQFLSVEEEGKKEANSHEGGIPTATSFKDQNFSFKDNSFSFKDSDIGRGDNDNEEEEEQSVFLKKTTASAAPTSTTTYANISEEKSHVNESVFESADGYKPTAGSSSGSGVESSLIANEETDLVGKYSGSNNVDSVPSEVAKAASTVASLNTIQSFGEKERKEENETGENSSGDHILDLGKVENTTGPKNEFEGKIYDRGVDSLDSSGYVESKISGKSKEEYDKGVKTYSEMSLSELMDLKKDLKEQINNIEDTDSDSFKREDLEIKLKKISRAIVKKAF